ncbi:MAG: ADP-forming succinate--CoA ligase subunit beta [Thermodesulfobacteriota bacterium]
MNIHEYQAKELFKQYEVPVPKGSVAFTTEEAVAAGRKLGGYPLIVKAQIHAGGRGKAGGVRLVKSEEEIRLAAAEILGMTIVTKQTGPVGKKVGKVLIEQGLNISRELYLSIIPDRTTAQIMIVASLAGGMDIEDVAVSMPEKIIKVMVNPLIGLQPFHHRQLLFGLDLDKNISSNFSSLLTKLYRLFTEKDCTMLEINPLVITAENQLVALDAKIDIDSSSLYRHQDIWDWRDEAEEDPLEVEAARVGLNYIKLDGNIGNMVNGAGLAMATMDLIKKAGAEPANFLDVGGGANAEMVEEGLRIILSDPKVKGILINIFGGILRCDVLADGVVEAARKTGITVPVVIRMEGTNVDKGRRILADSGLNLITAVDLADAANKIAEISRA